MGEDLFLGRGGVHSVFIPTLIEILFIMHLASLLVPAYHEISFISFQLIGLGFPPVFLSQPKDIIAENLLKTYRGIQAHIIITCNVTGTPTPTITWYRRGIEINIIFRDGHSLVRLQAPNEPVVLLIGLVDDMSLYLNLTAQVDSRETEYFHCLATNTLGETITAAARSRDVSVTFVSKLTCMYV